MVELWLNFTDEKGEPKRVLVEQEKFSIGRHSENDLCVPNGKLSREHVKIERFGDVCVISDCNSSNGTTLNGEDLSEPVALKNGDKLNLGGGLEIEVELVSDALDAANPPANGDENSADADSQSSSAAGSQSASAASSGGSIPISFFYLAPLFGVLILLFAGGIFFVFRGKGETNVVKNNGDFYYSGDSNTEIDSPPGGNSKTTPTPDTKSSPVSNNGFATPTPDSPNTQPTPQISDEKEKVKQTAALFLRRVAINDPNAFLTNKQTEIVSPKINQLKDSPALADNLKSAKRDSARIAEIARGKNLKPEFLATAALAKLGNQRGNVADTAQSISDVLYNLSIQIGNESSSDCLLILSAFEQGEAGDFMKMQNMLQSMASQFPGVSSTKIRTIWFLKENQKISDAQFDLGVRFIAIGTIMQNPSDFGVKVDAVTF
ncbi:MAG: FHA domain-containing protein [Pyrinomonadaceae bacterium]